MLRQKEVKKTQLFKSFKHSIENNLFGILKSQARFNVQILLCHTQGTPRITNWRQGSYWVYLIH